MESNDFSLLMHLDALLQEASVSAAARRIGLSTPAMSHALARIRERLGDPILVRSGRGMLLTPRAEALKSRVHAVVADARLALEPIGPFVAREMSRTFVVHASDYVLTILGLGLDAALRAQAPSTAIRFVPNTTDDAAVLRDGGSDLAVGIYGELPQELRSRHLLTDRFVCAVRQEHPVIGKRLSLEHFTTIPHIQIAPRGQPGGYIDDMLWQRGLRRNVARAVPYFLTALQLAAETDYLLTISERIALKLAPTLGLRVLEAPLELRPYALSLIWHPRFDGDAGHKFLRDIFAKTAEKIAGDRHAMPRTRLEALEPHRQKKPKKARI
jgi:DNA-binding transcriptional LysR family regulator